MATGSRSIEVVRSPEFGLVELNGTPYYVPSVSENANRANPVTVGDFVVQCTAGDSSQVDAVSAADTTGVAGRLIVGLVHAITDSKGRRLDQQILRTDQSGQVLVYFPTMTFRAVEDGVGGLISDANQFAHCALIRGTLVDATTNETNFPKPEANTMIDSSTVGGNATNRAIHLQGIDPDVTQLVGPIASQPSTVNGTTSFTTMTLRRNFLFKINPAFRIA